MNNKMVLPIGISLHRVSFITCLAIACSVFSSVTVFGQSAEEETIQKVLNTSFNEIAKGNLNGWLATWKQDGKTRLTFAGKDFHATVLGSDSIAKFMKNTFNPQPTTNPVQSEFKNLVIRVDGNMATADYEQTVRGPQADSTDRWHVFNTLIKENNEWKFTSQMTIWLNSYTAVNAQTTEDYLTRAAHNLLDAGKINEAIEVLKLNVKLYPKSWDALNHLGEAYTKAGNKELAAKHYKTAVELNPKNEKGKAALNRLRME